MKYADASWLKDRLGTLPDGMQIGLGDELGIDMSDFRDEGYIIRQSGDESVICAKTSNGLDRAVRYYAKYAPESGDFSHTYAEGKPIKSLTIAGTDISEYRIVMQNDRDNVHENAASDLVSSIEKATGAVLEVTDSTGAHNIVLKQQTEAEAEKSGLGKEGFTVEVDEKGEVTITGGYLRGCLYGVYDFLETYLGFRYLYDFDLTVTHYNIDPIVVYDSYEDAQIEYIPEADRIDIPAGEKYTETPDFGYRHHWHEPSLSMTNSYTRKRRSNGGETGVGAITCHGTNNFCHLFVDYSGIGNINYCYSNEENIEIAIEYLEESLNSRLAAGQTIGREIIDVDVGHADTPDFCNCNKCKKLYQQDGFYTGAVLYYTNSIAAAIAEDISPEIYVNMFGYWGTCTPPYKTKPLPNVAVAYCYYTDIEKISCYSHPFDGSECAEPFKTSWGKVVSNRLYADELKRWCELCTRVFVWYYPGSWSYKPFAAVTYKNTLKDIQFLKECGIYGFFTCPSYQTPEDALVAYLVAKLSWDCDITEEEYNGYVEEYLDAMYGDAADEIAQWIETEKGTQRQCCWNSNYFCRPTTVRDLSYYRDNFDSIVALFDEALADAGSYLEECRINHRAAYAYYPSLVTNYTRMFQNGTAEEKTLYLERWNVFDKYAKEYRISFGNHEGEYKPIFDFDINTTHPLELCLDDTTDTEWYFDWENAPD